MHIFLHVSLKPACLPAEVRTTNFSTAGLFIQYSLVVVLYVYFWMVAPWFLSFSLKAFHCVL